jgi:hypothetical protein
MAHTALESPPFGARGRAADRSESVFFHWRATAAPRRSMLAVKSRAALDKDSKIGVWGHRA